MIHWKSPNNNMVLDLFYDSFLFRQMVILLFLLIIFIHAQFRNNFTKLTVVLGKEITFQHLHFKGKFFKGTLKKKVP